MEGPTPTSTKAPAPTPIPANTSTPAPTATPAPFVLASLPTGAPANCQSGMPVISGDGRYVAFVSSATNLVPGFDTFNGMRTCWRDAVYLRDMQTGMITLVSAPISGNEANGESRLPAISADGRYIAFESSSSNLAADSPAGGWNLFVRDMQTGTTTIVGALSQGSAAQAGTAQPGAANGASMATLVAKSGAAAAAQAASGMAGTRFIRPESSTAPAISADGRFIAFASSASDLVEGDTNNAVDVFLHDRQTGKTVRVSVASGGTQGNGDSGTASISADGRFVAFESIADDLVENDTNRKSDVFVHDVQAGTTVRVSVSSDGTEAYAYSLSPSISADGRYVAFTSLDLGMVSTDRNEAGTDIYLHDLQTGITSLESVSSKGLQGVDQDSVHPRISADGRFIVFYSNASRLVPGDKNDSPDAFLRDTQAKTTVCLSLSPDGKTGDGFTGLDEDFAPGISADGRYVVFQSEAKNLTTGDTNDWGDAFLRDVAAGTTVLVSAGMK